MIEIKIKKPPIIVLLEGISLIPNIGSHTQKIPPMTSVNERRVNSAAWMDFDPIEYKIKPMQTKVPCTEKSPWFLLEDKRLVSVSTKITIDTIAHNKPAIATVVNFGVSFLHLNDTEKTEKPIAEASPNNNPVSVPVEKLPIPIIIIPTVANIIAIQTLKEIFSCKNKKPKKAVINGIAARHNKVTAAEVLVIDQIKLIIAIPKPVPPIKPDQPIFL